MRKTAMDTIYTLAKRDPRVVFVGSDLGVGVLDDMRAEFPDRFFMEGVSEQAIIGIAAGLAMNGFIPYINTIATFLTRRCFEQIAIDLCLHNLPVRLIASGGGTVYAPLGPTHMATEDLAILRTLPNMTVIAPSDAPEMTRVMEASLDVPGPVYVRIAKGGDPVISSPSAPFAIGRAVVLRPAAEVVFVGTGIATSRALDAADILDKNGVHCGVVHAHTIKPFDAETLIAEVSGARLIVTVEEHSRIGGLGSLVAETLADAGFAKPLLRLGLPDAFSRDYGNQDHVLARAGLTPADIAAATLARLHAAAATV